MEFMKKIEELSKKVGKTATETYNTVADKSGKIIEDTKLKMAISDKDDEIEEIYSIIGKTVYDMYKSGEDVGKVFEKESKKVDNIKSDITEMNKKVLYNKGLRSCSSCNETIELESIYCFLCGNKQKPFKIKEEKTSKDDKETDKKQKEDQVCPQCGLISSYKNKFCTKCGYKFEN